MKKFISILLALVMLVSLASVAFAVDGDPTDPTETTNPSGGTSGTITDTDGSITITGASFDGNKPVATYDVYQILKLNSFDTASGSYFYDYVGDPENTGIDWYDFFTKGYGKDYVKVDDTKHVLEWKGASDAASVANFAKEALKFAKDNRIAPTRTTATADNYAVVDGTIVFSGLQLGYYLVDSTVGALCGLTTTNPNGLINPKNGAPTLIKQVQEDLGGQWSKSNTDDIGNDINFRVTVHVHDGAQNYTLHDKLEEGFTFTNTHGAGVKVEVIDGVTGTTSVKTTGYTVNIINAQEFVVKFDQTFCDTLKTNDRLVIYYSATLNENAEIGNGTADNTPNVNEAYLSFGEPGTDGYGVHHTASDSTSTKTYAFDLVKTDGQNKLLDGSEFKIYTSADGTEEVQVVLESYQIDGYNVYRKAMPGETGVDVIVVRGKVRVIGLDNGTYWLDETVAPEGYREITGRQSFTISDNNLDAIITNGIVSTNSGVQVINNTGSMLPETGGLGTILFTILGGTTALGTGVVLVTKKRMSNIEED